MSTSETFVYDGEEVVLTGRTAQRPGPRGKEVTLHEIRPAAVDSNDPKFCKWVRYEKLFLIQ